MKLFTAARCCMLVWLFIWICQPMYLAAYHVFDYDTTNTGNPSAMYVTDFVTFQPGQYAKGNITFANGFSLTPSCTTEIEISGRVGGSQRVSPFAPVIRLNNGVLWIKRDLHLDDGSYIFGPGYINCDGDGLPAIVLHGDCTITGGDIRILPYYNGSLVFQGNNNRLTLDEAGHGAFNFSLSYANPIAYFFNTRIYNVSTATFKQQVSSYLVYLQLSNSDLNMTGDTTITTALTRISGNVNMRAPKGNVIKFSGSQIEIYDNSQLYVPPNTIFEYTNYLPLEMDGPGSRLYLDNCTWSVGSSRNYTSTTLALNNGALIVNGIVNLRKVPSGDPVLGRTFNLDVRSGGDLICLNNSKLKVNDNINVIVR